MSAIVDFKISQHAVKEYADEVRELEKKLKIKDQIIKQLEREINTYEALKSTDYGPPYGPHNSTGIKGGSK